MLCIHEDSSHIVFCSTSLTLFSFFVPSENKITTSHFSLEVLLARNVTVLGCTLDTQCAVDM